MEVNKFIAAVFIFLVETRVANLETVKIKLGGKEVIIPLRRPVHVTRLKGGDLSNLRLPVPNLADIISQARTSPQQPPPSPRLPTSPDRWDPNQIYRKQQNPQFYQPQPATNPQRQPPTNYYPNNNPELLSSNQVNPSPELIYDPGQFLPQQNGPPPYPIHSSYSAPTQLNPFNQNFYDPLPQKEDEQQDTLKHTESSPLAHKSHELMPNDQDQPSTPTRDHLLPYIPKDRYLHHTHIPTHPQKKPLSHDQPLPSLHEKYHPLPHQHHDLLPHNSHDKHQTSRHELHDRFPFHQRPLPLKENHTLLSEKPKPMSHTEEPITLHKPYEHHDNLIHEENHPLPENDQSNSYSSTRKSFPNQQDTTEEDSSLLQTTPSVVKDEITSDHSLTSEHTSEKSHTTITNVYDTVETILITSLYDNKMKLEPTSTSPGIIATSYVVPTFSNDKVPSEPTSFLQKNAMDLLPITTLEETPTLVTEEVTPELYENKVISHTDDDDDDDHDDDNTVALYPIRSLVDTKVRSETTPALLEDATTLRSDRASAIDNDTIRPTLTYGSMVSASVQKERLVGTEPSLTIKSTTKGSSIPYSSTDETFTAKDDAPTTYVFSQNEATEKQKPPIVIILEENTTHPAIVLNDLTEPLQSSSNRDSTIPSRTSAFEQSLTTNTFISITTPTTEIPVVLKTSASAPKKTTDNILETSTTTQTTFKPYIIIDRFIYEKANRPFVLDETLDTTVSSFLEQNVTTISSITDTPDKSIPHDTTTKSSVMGDISTYASILTQETTDTPITFASEHDSTTKIYVPSVTTTDTDEQKSPIEKLTTVPEQYLDTNSSAMHTTMQLIIKDTLTDIPITFPDQNAMAVTSVLNVTTTSQIINAITESGDKTTSTDQNTAIDTTTLNEITKKSLLQYTTIYETTISPAIDATTKSVVEETKLDMSVTLPSKQDTSPIINNITKSVEGQTVADGPEISADQDTSIDSFILYETTTNAFVQDTTTEITKEPAIDATTKSVVEETKLDMPVTLPSEQDTSPIINDITKSVDRQTVADGPEISADQDTSIDSFILYETTENAFVQDTTTKITKESAIEATTKSVVEETKLDMPVTLPSEQDTSPIINNITKSVEGQTVADGPEISADQDTSIDSFILYETTANAFVQDTTTEITKEPAIDVTTKSVVEETKLDMPVTLPSEEDTSPIINNITKSVERQTVADGPEISADQDTSIDSFILYETTANAFVQDTTTEITKEPAIDATTKSVMEETKLDIPVTLPSEQVRSPIINSITESVEEVISTDQDTLIDNFIPNRTTANMPVQVTTTNVIQRSPVEFDYFNNTLTLNATPEVDAREITTSSSPITPPPITAAIISQLQNTTKAFPEGSVLPTTVKPRRRRRPCKKHGKKFGKQNKTAGLGRRRRKTRSTTGAPRSVLTRLRRALVTSVIASKPSLAPPKVTSKRALVTSLMSPKYPNVR